MLVVGLVISRSLLQFPAGHFGLFLGKTVYSILPQSTQLQNGHLALIRQCLEHVRYMLPTALKCAKIEMMVSVCTGLLGEEGRVSASVDIRLKAEYLYLNQSTLILTVGKRKVM